MTGVGLVRANCGENNFFTVDGSKASPASPAGPKVSLALTSGVSAPVDVQLRQVRYL